MLIRAIAALLAATLAAQTSSISGTIRNAHNQIPIPGALVRLDDGERPLETFTDAAGHYRFSDIDQVTYNLRIEKDGYLFQPDYALPNQGSIVLDEKPLSLDYVMDQWTSLAGCVRDTDDKPVAEAAITLIPRGTPPGAPTIKTNSAGCYEFERVFPGSYYVKAQLLGTNPSQPATFYPATAHPSEAQRVPVAPGAARRGIDIQLAHPTLGVISGRIVDEEGKPVADGQILLSPAELGVGTGPINVSYMPGRFQPPTLMRVAPNAFPMGEIRMVRAGPDGLFHIPGLLPGSWRLILQSDRAHPRIYANERVELAPPSETFPETTVELRAQPMFDAQVQLDWSGPPPPLTRNSSLAALGMSQTGPNALIQAATDYLNSLPAKPRPAPTSMPLPFASSGLYSVSALVQSDILPDGYYFAAMRQGGVDLQGQPAQLTRNAPPITLVFKPKAATIHGTLDGETPAIVLLWGNDVSRDPAVRTAIAKPGGSFHFGSLAPGTYHLAAFDRLPLDGLTVPFLNTLTLTATTVTLAEGATANPKLKASRWPD